MITAIYQAPSSSFPGLPEGASAFIGNHTPPMPTGGETFDRYGRTWTVLQVSIPGPGTWSFRLAARPSGSPLITRPSPT
jgi:hypothetical protein